MKLPGTAMKTAMALPGTAVLPARRVARSPARRIKRRVTNEQSILFLPGNQQDGNRNSHLLGLWGPCRNTSGPYLSAKTITDRYPALVLAHRPVFFYVHTRGKTHVCSNQATFLPPIFNSPSSVRHFEPHSLPGISDPPAVRPRVDLAMPPFPARARPKCPPWIINQGGPPLQPRPSRPTGSASAPSR